MGMIDPCTTINNTILKKPYYHVAQTFIFIASRKTIRDRTAPISHIGLLKYVTATAAP
jgi:hypothetical protein